MFRLLPHGFRNPDLRGLLARLLGKTTDDIRPGRSATTYAGSALMA